ncbi:MAG: ATP-dependent DNA helicase [Clostridia bacterium]|nr:ATP-dependent DNA helicase [Clostridia bacterium]
MFELTRNESKLFEQLIKKKKVYPEGIYDFTFENQFIVYHYSNKRYTHYITVDKETELASEVKCVRNGTIYDETNYVDLVPNLLYSIKYTGDSRYLTKKGMSAEELINFIFKTVLPYHGYTVRDEQLKLSIAMYNGFKDHRVSINEAEVGTGKSLAYLVAGFSAKRFLPHREGPITITTSSIELQKALVEREIPNLSSMLQRFGIIKQPLTVVLRKGKEHYLCPRRYSSYYEQISKVKKYNSTTQRLEEIIDSDEKIIDLDKFDLRPSIKEKICVKTSCKKCKLKRCDDLGCGFAEYIERSNKTKYDFLVTNHNMYLMSLKIMNEGHKAKPMLHTGSCVVVDEAHKLKQAAEDIFGERLIENSIPAYISAVKHLCKNEHIISNYKDFIAEMAEMNQKFFQHLRTKTFVEDFENGSNTIIEVGVIEQEYLKNIKYILQRIEDLNDGGDENNEGQAESILNSIDKLLCGNEDMYYWLEMDENKVMSLCCAPKNISKTMYQYIWNIPDRSYILTSGTMSDGVNFDFFMAENGIDRLESFRVNTTTTESPFNYQKNARLYISKDMPFPDNESEEYIKKLTENIVKLVNATHGHTVVLFTSYNVLNSVFESVKVQLKNFDLICMTRSNKGAITDFKISNNAVLFASGAMWEGVDCAGDCLSSVIITRLPYPLRNATMEQKKARCKSTQEFVRKYAVPEMLIKLRQGVGRLIRTETDTGLVSILDSRAYDGANARRIQHVLRKYTRVKDFDEIEQFFKKVKSAKYFDKENKQDKK